MGVMEVNHFSSQVPVACYGAQLRPTAITEIAIYDAHQKENGEIAKDNLITKFRLSSHQFAKLICRTNASGHSATLESLSGFEVDESQMELNPAETKMSRDVSKSALPDEQISGFFSELDSLMESSKEKGRLVQAKEIEHLLKIVSNNAPSNYRHYLKELAITGNQKMNEAKSQIHSIIKNHYRLNESPLKLEDSSNKLFSKMILSPFCEASINHYTGSNRLFDEIGRTGNGVSLSLKCISTSEVEERLNDKLNLRDDYIHFNKEMVRITFSFDQFARFVRADKTEIPCTLTRIVGREIKDKITVDAREMVLGDVDSDVDAILSDFLNKMKETIEHLSSTKGKKTADRERLFELYDEAKSILNSTQQEKANLTRRVANDVVDSLQSEINRFSNDELLQLPESVRPQLMMLINKIK